VTRIPALGPARVRYVVSIPLGPSFPLRTLAPNAYAVGFVRDRFSLGTMTVPTPRSVHVRNTAFSLPFDRPSLPSSVGALQGLPVLRAWSFPTCLGVSTPRAKEQSRAFPLPYMLPSRIRHGRHPKWLISELNTFASGDPVNASPSVLADPGATRSQKWALTPFLWRLFHPPTHAVIRRILGHTLSARIQHRLAES